MFIIGDKQTAHVLLEIMDSVGQYEPSRSKWEGKADAFHREAVFLLLSLHLPHHASRCVRSRSLRSRICVSSPQLRMVGDMCRYP